MTRLLKKFQSLIVLVAVMSSSLVASVAPPAIAKKNLNGGYCPTVGVHGQLSALTKNDDNQINMSGCNLKGAYLKGLDMSDANLRGANLRGANLTWVNLSGADLTGANLAKANLYGVRARNADFNNTNLSSANLTTANFTGAEANQINLTGANLSWATFLNAEITDSKFSYANFYRSNFFGANLSQAVIKFPENLYTANLTKANFSYTDLSEVDFCNKHDGYGELPVSAAICSKARNVNFTRAYFAGGSFRTMDLTGSNFTGAHLGMRWFPDNGGWQHGVDFAGANLTNANFTNADLTGSWCRDSVLSGTKFKGAILDNSNCFNLPALRKASSTLRLSFDWEWDLTNADLSGLNLEGAIFLPRSDQETNTITPFRASGANFSGANLKGANFFYGDFRNSDFRNANLSGADGSGADFRNANFAGASLFPDTGWLQVSCVSFGSAQVLNRDLNQSGLLCSDFTGANLPQNLPRYWGSGAIGLPSR